MSDSPHITLRNYSNLLVLGVPLLLPVAWVLSPHFPALFAWLPLLLLYLVLPMMDLLLGRDQGYEEQPAGLWVNGLPLAAATLHLLVLGWSITVSGQLSGLGWCGWLLSQGVISGVVAINVAHELIHRRSAWLRQTGALLLASVNYIGFKIEHVRWHHVHVATANDPSSAPRGAVVFWWVPRALVLNTRKAWQLQFALLARSGQAFFSRQNELFWWQLLILCVALVIGLTLGWVAVGFFLLQGLIAATTLEIINYVEHYGLRRKRLANGRFEPPGIQHSWNTDFTLSNAVLLQLQRHSDHHANPTRNFAQLRSHGRAPQLPMGYAGMVLLAMVPPLWKKVMDHRIPAPKEADIRAR